MKQIQKAGETKHEGESLEAFDGQKKFFMLNENQESLQSSNQKLDALAKLGGTHSQPSSTIRKVYETQKVSKNDQSKSTPHSPRNLMDDERSLSSMGNSIPPSLQLHQHQGTLARETGDKLASLKLSSEQAIKAGQKVVKELRETTDPQQETYSAEIELEQDDSLSQNNDEGLQVFYSKFQELEDVTVYQAGFRGEDIINIAPSEPDLVIMVTSKGRLANYETRKWTVKYHNKIQIVIYDYDIKKTNKLPKEVREAQQEAQLKVWEASLQTISSIFVSCKHKIFFHCNGCFFKGSMNTKFEEVPKDLSPVIDRAFPIRLDSERNFLVYKKQEGYPQSLVAVNLIEPAFNDDFKFKEGELIDFRGIDRFLFYLLRNNDSYTLYRKMLKRDPIGDETKELYTVLEHRQIEDFALKSFDISQDLKYSVFGGCKLVAKTKDGKRFANKIILEHLQFEDGDAPLGLSVSFENEGHLDRVEFIQIREDKKKKMTLNYLLYTTHEPPQIYLFKVNLSADLRFSLAPILFDCATFKSTSPFNFSKCQNTFNFLSDNFLVHIVFKKKKKAGEKDQGKPESEV